MKTVSSTEAKAQLNALLAEVQRMRGVLPTFELSYNVSPVEVADDTGMMQRRLSEMRQACADCK